MLIKITATLSKPHWIPVTIEAEVETGNLRYETEKDVFLEKESEVLKRERQTKSKIPTRRQGIPSATPKPSFQKNSSHNSKNSGDPQQQMQIKDAIEFIQKNLLTLSGKQKKLRGQFSSE